MPLLETVVDNFNDNVVANPPWTNNYGGCTEVGGRARIPCVDASYAGYQTSKLYTLAGSSTFLELVTPPAVSTSTAAYAVFSVIGTAPGVPDGTNIGFTVNSVAGTLRCYNNVGYTDGAAVSLTYSNTTHRWMRLREVSGTVYWDTSTDGLSWTNRRTLATPAWITSSVNTLALDLYANRTGGATDYIEFDNVNSAPSASPSGFTGFGIPI